jgi:hypothetical protein
VDPDALPGSQLTVNLGAGPCDVKSHALMQMHQAGRPLGRQREPVALREAIAAPLGDRGTVEILNVLLIFSPVALSE